MATRRARLETCPTLLVAVLLIFAVLATAAEPTPPEKFFGFQLGADKKMARWDKIVEYYGVLEKQSAGRMKVINMGPTSEGNPFLMVIITSPANFSPSSTACARSTCGSAIRAVSRKRRRTPWWMRARPWWCSR